MLNATTANTRDHTQSTADDGKKLKTWGLQPTKDTTIHSTINCTSTGLVPGPLQLMSASASKASAHINPHPRFGSRPRNQQDKNEVAAHYLVVHGQLKTTVRTMKTATFSSRWHRGPTYKPPVPQYELYHAYNRSYLCISPPSSCVQYKKYTENNQYKRSFVASTLFALANCTSISTEN